MASITIRNLDPLVKQALRERAARNGRSMEEEARHLLGHPEPLEVSIPPVTTPTHGHLGSSKQLRGKRILLIIGGGIAAYKCLELIRRLADHGATTRVIMTPAAHAFVTPLSLGAISGDKVFTDLLDRDDEHDIGHIRLSREADLIVVAPATADLMAKMAGGHANDLATTTLMATDKPVLIAPAMNPRMWLHRATRRNHNTLKGDGIFFVGPGEGEMAESGESGPGRMAEPEEIITAVTRILIDSRNAPLRGRRAIVTSGPTHEPIDPVRYIANRSSGKQGHAIAGELAKAGAEVILISGPVSIPNPEDVDVINVETARQMQQMVETALPADIGVFVAAVADWRTLDSAREKMKKENGKGPSNLKLTENPDILKGVGHHVDRPELLIGFAAETEKVVQHAEAKLKRKNTDWIVANDVSPETGVMGGDENTIKLISDQGVEAWPKLSKQQVAERLVEKIAKHFLSETIDV